MSNSAPVLLTAFAPFDGTGWNASLEACRMALDSLSSEAVRFGVLPVEYGEDCRAMQHLLAEGAVRAIVHTGQAAGSSVVRVEARAVNLRYAPLGREEAPVAIDPAGPPELIATLDVLEVTHAIRAAGVPAVVSQHAGIYLCNHVLFRTLQRAHAPALFLHLPILPIQGGPPNLEVEHSSAAIVATIRHILATGMAHPNEGQP